MFFFVLIFLKLSAFVLLPNINIGPKNPESVGPKIYLTLILPSWLNSLEYLDQVPHEKKKMCQTYYATADLCWLKCWIRLSISKSISKDCDQFQGQKPDWDIPSVHSYKKHVIHFVVFHIFVYITVNILDLKTVLLEHFN